MGVKNLSAIFTGTAIEVKKSLGLTDLKDRTLAIDGFNQLYQFISSIRDATGGTLIDEEGRTTSHLIGLLTRNCALLQKGIQPVYVFDGQSHELKLVEQTRRREKRAIAEIEYNNAIQEGDLARARMFGRQVNRLTSDMIEDSKKLLDLMGIPCIDAPGEGEAQAAQMASEGIVWACASQDYDAVLFGSPILIRNLNITGKRTLPGGKVKDIKIEKIVLNQLLSSLDMTREQLVDLGILMGTDFNPDGFKKIGVKTAYKLIKKYHTFEEVRQNNETVKNTEIPYEIIKNIFLKPNVTKNVKVDFTKNFEAEKIIDYLVKERNFSENRYVNIINKTAKEIELLQTQTSLDDWF